MKRMSASFSRYLQTIGCPFNTFSTGWSIIITFLATTFLSALFSRQSSKALRAFFPTMRINSMIWKTCGSAAVALSWLSKKKSSEAIKTKRFTTSGVRSHLHIIPSKSIYSLHESLRRKLDSSPLRRKKIQKHFAGIAFRQALAIQPDSLAEYDEAEDTEFIHGLLDADFKLYCGVSSVLQLNDWPEAISSDSTLMELSEALVDPNRPAYPTICSISQREAASRTLDYFQNTNFGQLLGGKSRT